VPDDPFTCSPRRRVITNTKQGQRGHKHGVNPAAQHDERCRTQLDAMVQVHGLGDGEPALDGNHGQREYRQMAGKYGEKAGCFTAEPCENRRGNRKSKVNPCMKSKKGVTHRTANRRRS